LRKPLFALFAVGAIVAMQQQQQARATSGTLYTSKYVPLTIVITPSPVVYAPFAGNVIAADASRDVAYDPFAMPDLVAQASPP
jgi:hypothetical protein